MLVRTNRSMRTGFTLIELLVVISVMGVLMAILLPALSAVRESANRLDCQNRMKQMGVATIAYQASQGFFPVGKPWPDVYNPLGRKVHLPPTTNYNWVRSSSAPLKTNFLSVHVALLPYLEMQGIADMMNYDTNRAIDLSDNPNETAYTMAAGAFLCPSDRAGRNVVGENCYRYNFGGSTPYSGWKSVRGLMIDLGGGTDPQKAEIVTLAPDFYANNVSVQGNGAFTIRRGLTGVDFVDGLTNTAFFSERDRGSTEGRTEPAGKRPDRTVIVGRPQGEDMGNREIPPSPQELFDRCQNFNPGINSNNFFSAGRWAFGSDYSNGWPFAAYTSTMYNHVAPPNWKAFDCGTTSSIPDVPGEHAIITARSSHSGVVNVCFGDGHVEAVSDSIDVGIWRAMGSRNGGETVRAE
jgi:prepilin-type N-terminal cleavage/methylation domain-containing protein/prepilin-type processing-associated H-X9-DG protein